MPYHDLFPSPSPPLPSPLVLSLFPLSPVFPLPLSSCCLRSSVACYLFRVLRPLPYVLLFVNRVPDQLFYVPCFPFPICSASCFFFRGPFPIPVPPCLFHIPFTPFSVSHWPFSVPHLLSPFHVPFRVTISSSPLPVSRPTFPISSFLITQRMPPHFSTAFLFHVSLYHSHFQLFPTRSTLLVPRSPFPSTPSRNSNFQPHFCSMFSSPFQFLLGRSSVLHTLCFTMIRKVCFVWREGRGEGKRRGVVCLFCSFVFLS